MPDLEIDKGQGSYSHLHHGYHDHDGKYAMLQHEHDEYLEHRDMQEYAKKCDVPTKGTAGAGLGLGIAGTALGVYNAWRDRERREHEGYHNGNGRYYGNGGCGEGYCEEDHKVNRFELRQSEKIAEVQMQLAKERAERYAETGDFDLFQKLTGKIDYLAGRVCDMDKENAVKVAKLEGQIDVLKEGLIDVKLDAKAQLRAAIALEEERRFKEDELIMERVNCNFIRNKKVLDPSIICPPVVSACPGTTTTATTNAAA
jgi:hypothetical protein